jgi:hypothetical protein
VTWPPEDASGVIADAFELRGQKGSDLLSRMGRFDLWRGDLAAMRGDTPATPAKDRDNDVNADRFLQTLAVSRALNELEPRCATVVRLVYSERSDLGHVASELDTSLRYAETLVRNCTQRLFEVAKNLYGEMIQSSEEEAEKEERGSPPAIPLPARADYDRIPAERK